MGLLLYALIMRGLRDTAEVTKIVVTCRSSSVACRSRTGSGIPRTPRTVKMFFGDESRFSFFGATVHMHEVICLVAAVLIAVGLRSCSHPHPPGCLDARRRRRPGSAAAQRSQPRADRGLLVGPRLHARSGRRHPDHPDQRRHPRGEPADAAGDRRVRRRHVRPTAQHPAHVRRRDRSRPGRNLRARLLPLGVDVDVQPACLAADDRAVRRPSSCCRRTACAAPPSAPASGTTVPTVRKPSPGAPRCW